MKAFLIELATTLRHTVDLFWLKTIVAWTLGQGFWVVFGHDVDARAYVGLSVLFAIDLATGITKARRRGTYSSALGWRRTAAKFGNLLVIIASARWADEIVRHVVFDGGGAMVRAALLYLAAHELKSIDENLVAAKGIGISAILKRFGDAIKGAS